MKKNIDLSEKAGSTELIQDVNDFFPLFGITLGKTTWKQAETMGYKVKHCKPEESRTMNVEDVDFWDHEGVGVFTSMYLTRDENDIPSSWLSKGFSWELTYDEWILVFVKLGFNLTISKQPSRGIVDRNKMSNTEFDALSPDGKLEFTLEFNNGESDNLNSSCQTLDTISVNYKGLSKDIELIENEEELIEEADNELEQFDPTPLLESNHYHDGNFIFWFNDTKKIYESYIQNDTCFIVSELVIDESNHCIHRKRVGEIPMDSWMFWQMEREKVDNLNSITHFGAHYTLFHYQVQSDGATKDKYFDYNGQKIDDPDLYSDKSVAKCNNRHLGDYIDLPIYKAAFSTVLVENRIFLFRHINGYSEHLAILSVKSDFGKSYFVKVDNDRSQTSETFSIYRSDDKSFTIRCKNDNLLYKYDFEGKLIKKGTIAAYEAGASEALSDIDIDKLWHVFDNKDTSYKYFWFLSILQLYKEKKHPTINHNHILARMVSNAWKYVLSEKAEFSRADQIPIYINKVKSTYILDVSSDREKIEGQILYYFNGAHSERILSSFLNKVPYRFLSPWIPFTGNDEDVVAKSNESDARSLYSLHDESIVINPIWRSYLIENYDKIEEFIEEELRTYLKCKQNTGTMTITEFTRKCRDLQGRFREKMREPMGVGPFRNSTTKQVNMLVDGEKTGKNFVNSFTFKYALRRVRNLQPHETINEYRLFNNMLSSQPMAFNLFCPLMKMLKDGKHGHVNRILKAIFPDMHIDSVTEIDLEYLHTDIKKYLNDCTAMDAIVRYMDTDNKPAFIAIETKYTDVLGENTSSKERAQHKYHEWIKRLGMFKPEAEKELIDGKKVISQIYRNFLLTECYGALEPAHRCYSVVLAPAQHPTTEKEVASLKDELKPEYQYKISAISLEDFIERTLKFCPETDKAPFLYFKERYIP